MAAALALLVQVAAALPAAAQERVLGKEDILVYGIGLKVEPATQTVPKDFATIVSAFLQAPTLPNNLPPFSDDAEVRATLRGPSFQQPVELVAKPNSPLQIPVLSVPGTHTVENIRLISKGQVVLYGSPEVATIEVIEKLLVTTVTTRALTADEIREKGIVFDKSNFQAYNFTAAFAIDDGSKVDITFPVVLPTLQKVTDVTAATVDFDGVEPPQLQSLKTLVPDTLRIQQRIPNLSVVGFTLTLDDTQPQSQSLVLPPIPGVIVIPGDIGFLNQFFSVMLMVSNVAPTGSKLVVTDLTASIVLPAGNDNVVGSDDDPLRMARRADGEYPRVVAVTQPGPDGKLGTGDDVTSLAPGQTSNAEYLVEGRREGTHVVEMELAGTLNGLPVGPVPIRGRAAGAVLVRNPKFTLTFTHPETVNAGEPYTLDVTITNTSESPANFVSINLFAQNVSGARLDDDPTKGVDAIAPNDSATVTFKLISNRTGKVTAATLDSDENVAGRFVLKSAVGELGVPLSPDSLVLPAEANALPKALRDAALGVLGRAWAIATAPPAALPKDLTRFSKQVVLDRGVETAEAGLRLTLGEALPTSAATLWFDYLGIEFSQLADKVPTGDTTGLLGLLQRDVQGFDLVRRRSVRGDVFAGAVADILGPEILAGPRTWHQAFAEQMTSKPGHVSVLLTGAGSGGLAFDAQLVDASGRRLGGTQDGKVIKEIPFGDVLAITDGQGALRGQLLVVAVPDAGPYSLQLTPRGGADTAATYDVSVVLPGATGGLRFGSLTGVRFSDGFALSNGASDPAALHAVTRDASGGSALTAALSAVADPSPTLLGARQVAGADMAGCPLDPQRVHQVGRVIAVLFSEEVTPESAQDKVAASAITNYQVEGNRIVGVALQPGRRVVYLALREPLGPIVVPRHVTVDGVQDLKGHTVTQQSAEIIPTIIEAGGIVSGQVLQADGTPMPFASVRLFYEFDCGDSATTAGIAEDTTDANGKYQFDFVLKAPGMVVKLVAVDTVNDESRTVRFALARDRQQLNVNVVFLGRGTYTGRTIAEDGTILPGTKLRITSQTDQSQYAATSDDAGAFTVARVPVGNLLVEAVNTARPAQVFLSDTIPFAGATVAHDIQLLDVDLTGVVVKYGSIAGRVLRADGVTGVAGVPVVLYYKTRSQAGVKCPPPPGSTTEPGECALDIATSSTDGSFSFPAAISGELRVYSFDQAALQEGQVQFVLAPDQSFSANLLLGGGFGTVAGIVLDASGSPVADAVVGGGLSLVNVTPSGQDVGRFTMRDVPVGRRDIVAVSQALQAEGKTTIDLVVPGETVNATVVLEPTASISGIVRNRDGVPQAGVRVWVFTTPCYDKETLQESICVDGQVTTDANGAYRVDKLKLGTYSVSAFLPGFKDGNVGKVALRYAGQVLRNDITFRGGFGIVNGRVLRAAPTTCDAPPCTETPLAAKVGISGERLVVAGGMVGVEFKYVQNYEVQSNDITTGAFLFKNVWVGPVTVRAAGLFSPEPVAAETAVPAPGATTTVDLRLQPTSRITGTVYDSDGFTPVTNRQISLKFKSDSVVVVCTDDPLFGTECQSIPQGIQEMFAATDSHGQFVFPIVNAGPFTITASDDSGSPNAQGKVAEIKGQVRAGDQLDVSLRLLGRGRLTVRVFRSDGSTPVNGATVKIKQLQYPQREDSGVATNGTIAFDGVAEGDYVVSAIDQFGNTNGGVIAGGRKSARIAQNNDNIVADVYLFDAAGTLTGIVTRTDASNNQVPVPNAEVVVSNGSGPIAFAITDAQGQYSLDLVPPGVTSVDGFDPVTAGRGHASVTVVASQINDASVTLQALGAIRGTLVQSGLLTPLKGWTVDLYQWTPSGRPLPQLITQTGVDGGYAFPGASVGSFYLRAHKTGLVADATASGQLLRPGQLVEVPLVATIDRRVTATVTGTVTTGSGAPIANAQVQICPAGEACRATVADGQGAFRQDDLPLGRFYVRATAQVTGNPTAGTTGGTLLFEGDVAEVTVTLLGLSTIEGTVFQTVNGVRQAAPNATVRLDGQPGSGCPGACVQSSGPDGGFRFVNVPARSFTITASNLAGQQGSVGDVINPGTTRSGLQIDLAAAFEVRGRVLASNGTPAAGVVAEFIRGGLHLFAETAGDGTFSFAAIQPGAFSISFQDPIGPGLARRSGTVVGSPLELGDVLLDDAPPTVVESTPSNGALSVSQTTGLRFQFSETVSAATVNATHVTLSGPDGPVTGLVDLVQNDTVARFQLLPGVQLRDQARYSFRVTGVKDLVGRPMAADYAGVFTTVDVTPPSVAETTPGAAASGVSVNTTIRVRYNEIIDPAKFSGAAITLVGPQGDVAGRVDAILGNTAMVFTPQFPLAEDATYQVRLAAASDLAGNVQAVPPPFSFSTTDRTPPVITSLVPARPTVVQNAIVDVVATLATTDVAFVDFYVNGTFAYTDRVPPFVMSLQASPAFGGPGTHLVITALAADTSGNRATVPATAAVDVVADQAPSPAVVSPAVGTSAPNGARVDVVVRATDDVGVTKIAYAVKRPQPGPNGSALIDVQSRTFAATADRSETFSFTLPNDVLPGTLLSIEGTATDTAGQSQTSTPLLLRVTDAIAPTVEITGVSSGQRVQPGQTVTAVVTANDAGGVATVGFATSGPVVRNEQRQIAPAQNAVATSFQFTVPANATASDRVVLSAFALDGSGNRGDAAQITLPLADRVAPGVTVRTSTGTADMVPGATVQVVVDGTDDVAVQRLSLTGTGAFPYSDSKSFATPSTTASAVFSVSVPASVAPGAVLTLTARATDASGNVSTPATLVLTARTLTDVTMPASQLLRAGESVQVSLTLGTPAPAAGVRVDLSSGATNVATITPSLFFAAGETSKAATLVAVSGGTSQITASIDGITKATSTVTVIGGVVTGTVVTAGLNGLEPVAGAQVTVFHSGLPIATTSDAAGAFHVEGVLGGGSYYDPRGFTVTATNGALLGSVDAQLNVVNGSADVTVILIEAGAIEGTVFLAGGTTPAGANVQVNLYEAAAPNVVFKTAFTDASGGFRFPLAAVGDYVLEATDQSGNRARAGVSVSSGATTHAPLTFLGRVTLVVTVKSGAGANVPGATVELRASSIFGGAPLRSATTDGNGSATFADVFVGSAYITARDQQTGQGGSTNEVFTGSQNPVNVTVTLASFGNITGTVFRPGGTTPVPGATVTAQGSRTFTTTADANGAYSFLFLPLATYTVYANDPGTGALGVNLAVVNFAQSGVTVTRNVTLREQGALLVTVIDAVGQPVNGANVSVQVSDPPLLQNRTGVTGLVNGTAGQLLLERMLAGSFTISATANGLSGKLVANQPTQIVAGSTTSVTLQLQATASIGVLVHDQDGQSLAAGTAYLLNSGGAQVSPTALVNGAASFEDLPLGTYTAVARDVSGRTRAVISGILLASNGETQNVTLTFVALGTVSGRVIPVTPGGDVGNYTVTLQALNPSFGGYASSRTDAAGYYSFDGVAVGGVRVSVSRPDLGLSGENTGTLTYTAPNPAALSLDIPLVNNTVNWNVDLHDVNDSGYLIGQGGVLLASNTQVFYGGSGMRLSLTANGTTTPFTGPAFGVRENGGREISTRELGVDGLNVTRKVFVPADGYFARYLEILTNPTDQPITVDVQVQSSLYAGRTYNCFGCSFPYREPYVATTSSGDGLVDVTSSTPDRWIITGGTDAYYDSQYTANPVAFVMGGDGATRPVTAASFSPNRPQAFQLSTLQYGWQGLTVPPGQTVTLMHFAAPNAYVTGATAAAQRLAQLPPEALAGMAADELATVVNFVVPANGVSSVAPLAPVNGTVTGRVFEGDGVTRVGGGSVVFQSANPIYERRWTYGVNGNGEFSFTGAPGRPVPIGPFKFFANYPASIQYPPSTQVDDVTFESGATTVQHDLVFQDYGLVAGTVRRPNGTPVAGAYVTVAGRQIVTGADGAFRFGALFAKHYDDASRQYIPPATYAVTGFVQHSQGSAIQIVQRVFDLSPGQSLLGFDVTLQPTGSVRVTVTDSGNIAQPGRAVSLTGPNNFSRYASPTDSNGQLQFGDVPVGTYTVTTVDPITGLNISGSVTVVADGTVDRTLKYLGNGTVTVLVTRANGQPIQGMAVQVSGAFSTKSGTTAANGVATIGNVPMGQSATVLAYYPGNAEATIRALATVTTSDGLNVPLQLPAFGSVTIELRQPKNDALAGPGQTVQLSKDGGPGNYYSFNATTGEDSRVTFAPIPVGTTFQVVTQHPSILIDGSKPTLAFQALSVTADAQAPVIQTHYPAVARLVITVQDGASPVQNSQVQKVFNPAASTFGSALGTTNTSGVIDLARFVEGVHALRALKPGVTGPYPATSDVIEVATATIARTDDAGTVNVTIAVNRFTNVVVTGTLVEANGTTPLPNTFVQLLRAVDLQSLASVYTAADGSFRFDTLQSVYPNAPLSSTGGGFVVRARGPVDNRFVNQTAIPVASNSTLSLPPMVMPYLTATLRGTLRASDGVAPVEGGVAFLTTKAGNSSFGQTTNALGVYQFQPQPLPTEGVNVVFSFAGVADFTATGPAITQSGQVVTIDGSLPASVLTTVTGTVLLADGVTPAVGANVAIRPPSGPCANGGCYGSAGPDGRFSVRAAIGVDGQFTLRASWQNNSEVFTEKPFTVATQGAVVDAGSFLLPITRLTGTVVAADGVTPVAGARVNATVAAGPCTQWPYCAADAAADGTFTISIPGAFDSGLTVRAYSINDATVFAEKTFSSPTGQGVIDGGLFQLPISIVKGRVTRGGSPVANPTVFAISATNVTRFADFTDADGNYLIAGLKAGTYTVTAQDPDTSAEASTTVDLATDGDVAAADIQLPETGSLEVVVRDRVGSLTDSFRLALTMPSGSFERYCGPFDDVTPSDGTCYFNGLPLGDYYAQVALRTCDDNGNCQTDGYASTSGSLTFAGQTVYLEVAFEPQNQLVLDLTDFANSVDSGEPLDVELLAAGSSGPLGAYTLRIETTLPEEDGDGRRLLSLGPVPTGPARVTVRRTNQDDNLEVFSVVPFEMPPAEVESPYTVTMYSWWATSFWAGFWGGDFPIGTPRPFYFFDEIGRATYGSGLFTRTSDTESSIGNNNAFDYASMMTVDGREPVNGPGVPDGMIPPPYGARDENGEIIMGPYVTSRGTALTRRVYAPSNMGFARYLDEFTNTTGVPVTLDVSYETRTAGARNRVATTSQAGGFGTSYRFTDPSGGSVNWGEVLSGPTGIAPFVGYIGTPSQPDAIRAIYRITVPADGKVSLLHYVVIRAPGDDAGVSSQAQGLMNRTAPNALTGLSTQDKQRVVNFSLPLP